MEKAKLIEQLIKESGYNLRSFAEKCNMPYTSLYTILKKTGVGKASVETILRICRELGITIDELEERAGSGGVAKAIPTYDDVELLIARNGKQMSAEQKLKLIKLLSEIN